MEVSRGNAHLVTSQSPKEFLKYLKTLTDFRVWFSQWYGLLRADRELSKTCQWYLGFGFPLDGLVACFFVNQASQVSMSFQDFFYECFLFGTLMLGVSSFRYGFVYLISLWDLLCLLYGQLLQHSSDLQPWMKFILTLPPSGGEEVQEASSTLPCPCQIPESIWNHAMHCTAGRQPQKGSI